MNKIYIKEFLKYFCYLSIIVCSVIILFFKFSNPQLTDTQILIEKKEPIIIEWIAIFVLLFISYNKENKNY